MQANSIGARLKMRREELGLSLSDVQAATKIRSRYLEALEADEWSAIPGDVYIKGFLRTYANFLGLDGEELVAQYKSLCCPPTETVPLEQAAPPPPPSPRTARIGLWLLVLAVAVGVAAGLWLVAARAGWLGPSAAPTTKGAPPSPPPVTSNPGQPVAPPGQPRPPTVSVSESPGKRSFRVAGATSLEVQGRATARCWVRVWVDGSAEFHDQMLEPGDTAVWRAQRRLDVRVGYPTGLRLTVNGVDEGAAGGEQPIDLAFQLASGA